jgi:hypothetical protein
VRWYAGIFNPSRQSVTSRVVTCCDGLCVFVPGCCVLLSCLLSETTDGVESCWITLNQFVKQGWIIWGIWPLQACDRPSVSATAFQMEFVCHFLGRTYWGPTVVVLPDFSNLTQMYHQKHLEITADIWRYLEEMTNGHIRRTLLCEDTPIPIWTTLADAPWLDGKRFPSPRVQAWENMSADRPSKWSKWWKWSKDRQTMLQRFRFVSEVSVLRIAKDETPWLKVDDPTWPPEQVHVGKWRLLMSSRRKFEIIWDTQQVPSRTRNDSWKMELGFFKVLRTD